LKPVVEADDEFEIKETVRKRMQDLRKEQDIKQRPRSSCNLLNERFASTGLSRKESVK